MRPQAWPVPCWSARPAGRPVRRAGNRRPTRVRFMATTTSAHSRRPPRNSTRESSDRWWAKHGFHLEVDHRIDHRLLCEVAVEPRATGGRHSEDLLAAGSHNTTAEDDAGGSTHDPLARRRAPVGPLRSVLRGIISRHRPNANQHRLAGPLSGYKSWIASGEAAPVLEPEGNRLDQIGLNISHVRQRQVVGLARPS